MTILGRQHPPLFDTGTSDYLNFRESAAAYVDKTAIIADLVEGGAQVLALPRPRRFGKTLNLSTMRYFFERDETRSRAKYFQDTAIAQHPAFEHHFARYPVIALSFKSVKATTWADAWVGIRTQILDAAAQVERHYPVSPDRHDGVTATQWYRQRDERDTPSRLFESALRHLTERCAESTGERVVVLIDEYDAPLHAAWLHGYWDQAVAFFSAFLSEGLKDNRHLFRGVLTGILHVAKENIFSGLNNVTVRGVLHHDYAERFGFTESEVLELLHLAGRADQIDEFRRWYDGYRFGDESAPVTIYNPWSVLTALAQPTTALQPWWLGTSSNDLVRQLLVRHAADVGPELETLVIGAPPNSSAGIAKVVSSHVALRDVEQQPEALWALLLHTGYLTPGSYRVEEGTPIAELRIPNLEVATIYRRVFLDWLQAVAPRSNIAMLTKPMLAGDAESFAEALEVLLVRGVSHHDIPKVGGVEAVYQAFLLGLLVQLHDTHRVWSNREAGHGRADVLIAPRDPGTGVVLELKVVGKRETPEQALARAATQLRTRRYDVELAAVGARPIHQYAIVFDGKRCWVQQVPVPAEANETT